MKTIFYLMLILQTFHKIYLAILITFILLLLNIKLYISIYNRIIYIKIKIPSGISL